MNAEEFLQELHSELKSVADDKIKKAMQLFIRCDDNYRYIVLRMTGFSGELDAKALRDHFENLDLLDMLDHCIDEMEEDISYSHLRKDQEQSAP